MSKRMGKEVYAKLPVRVIINEILSYYEYKFYKNLNNIIQLYGRFGKLRGDKIFLTFYSIRFIKFVNEDVYFPEIFSKCKSLQFEECRRVTGKLWNNIPQLEFLRFYDSPSVKDAVVEKTIRIGDENKESKLKVLVFEECNVINSDIIGMLKTLRTRMPQEKLTRILKNIFKTLEKRELNLFIDSNDNDINIRILESLVPGKLTGKWNAKLVDLVSFSYIGFTDIGLSPFLEFPSRTTMSKYIVPIDPLDDAVFDSMPNVRKIDIRLTDGITGEVNLNSFEKLKSVKFLICERIKNKFFEKTPNIEQITLAECPLLTGDGWMQMNFLKTLVVSECPITDKVFVVSRKSLDTCSIEDCEYLEGKDWDIMKELSFLHIKNCAKFGDNAFSKTPMIKYIEIESCELLNGVGWERMEFLTDVDIKSCDNIKDGIFFAMSNVVELSIHNCNLLRGKGRFSLPKLEKLFLRDCNSFEHLFFVKTPILSSLTMRNCDKITQFIKMLANLKILNVRDMNITDQIFGKMPSLEALVMEKCHEVEGKEWKIMNKLKLIKIVRCENITDEFFDKVPNVVEIRITLSGDFSVYTVSVPEEWKEIKEFWIDDTSLTFDKK